MVGKIIRILNIIDTLEIIPDDLQGLEFLRPHPLKGNYAGYWSLTVNGNYRIIFQFDNKSHEASILDFLDYH